LPGHVFRVVALDGNPVPNPAEVPILWLGTAERISAVVEMRHPGIWVMGDLADDDRGHGMGIVVEYAGRKGKPQWAKPKPFRWDYARFGRVGPPPQRENTLTTPSGAELVSDFTDHQQRSLPGAETGGRILTSLMWCPSFPQRQRYASAAPAPAQL
jgi:FtsP/CotA-like multicopper oxidase with cupredoxin domain